MSKRSSRSGGKFGGNHTTFIAAAAIAADIAATCGHVTIVSSGVINTPRNKSGSRRHVKIVDTEHCILLGVTDGAAHQDVRVYTNNSQETKLYVAKGARDAGLTISFGTGVGNGKH